MLAASHLWGQPWGPPPGPDPSRSRPYEEQDQPPSRVKHLWKCLLVSTISAAASSYLLCPTLVQLGGEGGFSDVLYDQCTGAPSLLWIWR